MHGVKWIKDDCADQTSVLPHLPLPPGDMHEMDLVLASPETPTKVEIPPMVHSTPRDIERLSLDIGSTTCSCFFVSARVGFPMGCSVSPYHPFSRS